MGVGGALESGDFVFEKFDAVTDDGGFPLGIAFLEVFELVEGGLVAAAGGGFLAGVFGALGFLDGEVDLEVLVLGRVARLRGREGCA